MVLNNRHVLYEQGVIEVLYGMTQSQSTRCDSCGYDLSSLAVIL